VLHTNDAEDTGFGPHHPGEPSLSWTMQAHAQFIELWGGDEAEFEVQVTLASVGEG